MFIPEKPYLVDLEGLLGELQKHIQELNECLYCGKWKSNAFAVQTHMRDKGHCKIPFTTEAEQLEIGEFYDFRSTYSDDEDSEDESDVDQPAGGAKLGAKRSTKAVGEARPERQCRHRSSRAVAGLTRVLRHDVLSLMVALGRWMGI